MKSLENVNTFLLFLKSELEIEDESFLEPGSILQNVDEWDSLTVMTLLAVCDETFNIELDPDHLDDCKTPDELYNLVKNSQQN
jgi:acyl carrier protein|tara:strand:+ start:302 stop:550 length:249 start_codon:yes stop_codon:yes gene_type:complete